MLLQACWPGALNWGTCRSFNLTVFWPVYLRAHLLLPLTVAQPPLSSPPAPQLAPPPAPQDAARAVVSRLIDANQRPEQWPLLELVQWLEALVNSCRPGKAGPFGGAFKPRGCRGVCPAGKAVSTKGPCGDAAPVNLATE